MISAVILTHNDEAIISRCLESLGWCDEVIVVDDQSTDGTVIVAKKLGAKVYIHPLHDDFAAQRNFGLEKTKNNWVLFVDSDEVVTEALKKEILQKADSKQQTASGYFIKRKDYWGGRWLTHGETGNVKLLRLARKESGKWVQPVHEEWKMQGDIGELTHPLLHYPHQNVAQFLEEINQYSGLYAQYLFEQGVREPAWYIAGKPLAKFFVNYIWRLGFLDGTAGIVVALMMSFHSFLVRAKLWQIYDVKKKNIL
ncbi:MAG: glycosyltransferase family 2 protein [Patescibacteria group bacterium]